jgi:ABC-type multidrug transport system ATPase subunit
MIVGPMRVLFMDEISTGLDSSTTFNIVKSLRRFTHQLSATVLISLLQPAPETFDLFDDVLLLSEGQVVYHGPIGHVADFFESCGFKSPERKGIADFLQEVIVISHHRISMLCEIPPLGAKVSALDCRSPRGRIRSSIGWTSANRTGIFL